MHGSDSVTDERMLEMWGLRECAQYRVFAYGSNMHIGDLRRVVEANGRPIGTLASVEAAALPGYRLTFDYYSRARRGVAANVTESGTGVASYTESEVFGTVLHVDDLLLSALDEKEGHPYRYRRVERRVLLRSGESMLAWVYVVTSACRVSAGVVPSRHYLDLIVEAAVVHSLPESYVRSLRAVRAPDRE
jgi:gamma-glutamylcyclotransferase (GGCT)/AIG2-like uncharacterized protein YtfP